MITFERVSKRYDKRNRPALQDINVTVKPGEFVFLVGPSGSGKSTFMRLILREEKATAGKVVVAGRNVGSLSRWKVPQLRRGMGAVFQDFRLLSNKTVYQNVAFTLQVLGRKNAQIERAVPEVLDLVGLADKSARYPHQLSGGEQQRVAIARAFVNRPPLLLADEPTGNLDSTTSAHIMALFDTLNCQGVSIIMVTHEEDVAAHARRVIRLQDGRIQSDVATGAPGNHQAVT